MSEHACLVPCLVLHGVAFPVTKVTTVTGQLHPPLIPHHARHRPLRHGPGRILRRELSECQEKPVGGPEQCRADHDDDASTASEGEHRSVPEVKQEMKLRIKSNVFCFPGSSRKRRKKRTSPLKSSTRTLILWKQPSTFCPNIKWISSPRRTLKPSRTR